VRTGAVEMMNTGWGGYAGSIPELAAPEHPFLYSSAKANAAAREGILNVLTGVFESKANQKALACFYVGAMELITTKPVKTMDDWKGMLVQTDTSLGIALISQLGGSGEIIPFPEVYSAMEKGVVDASLLAPSFVLIAKINEIADYYTLFHALGTVHGFTVNLDIWNNMPPNVQNILVEEIKQTAKTLNDLYVNKYDDDTQALAGSGVEVYHLPKAEREKWMEVLRPYTEEKLAAMGEIGQKIKQVAEEASSKYPYPY
jgi:TRAP-type C4-dicarboxylate transport system substrate-binding protein